MIAQRDVKVRGVTKLQIWQFDKTNAIGTIIAAYLMRPFLRAQSVKERYYLEADVSDARSNNVI